MDVPAEKHSFRIYFFIFTSDKIKIFSCLFEKVVYIIELHIAFLCHFYKTAE